MANAAPSIGDARMVTGLFKDSKSVERAYQSVAQRGYAIGDINVVMSDDTRKKYFSDDRHVKNEQGSKAAEGGGLGGLTGGGIGILIPVLAAGAVLALPGLSLILAGPIAAALAGAGAAGLAVGLIGALHLRTSKATGNTRPPRNSRLMTTGSPARRVRFGVISIR